MERESRVRVYQKGEKLSACISGLVKYDQAIEIMNGKILAEKRYARSFTAQGKS